MSCDSSSTNSVMFFKIGQLEPDFLACINVYFIIICYFCFVPFYFKTLITSVISTVCYNTKHKEVIGIQANGENDNNSQN